MLELTIKPEAVDPDDVEMLQDMVMAAVNARRCAWARKIAKRPWQRWRPAGWAACSKVTNIPEPIDRMASELARLPGIGPQVRGLSLTHIASLPESEVRALARRALWVGRTSIRFCEACGNYTQDRLCRVCAGPNRIGSVLCVVRDARDVAAMERMHTYRGRYHVLQGVLSPMDGIGPDDIRVRRLLDRLADNQVEEVIIATNPDIEGEATAAYLARLIKPLGVKVTRIAHGVPVGSAGIRR